MNESCSARLAKVIADNFTATEVAHMRDYFTEFHIYRACVQALTLKCNKEIVKS